MTTLQCLSLLFFYGQLLLDLHRRKKAGTPIHPYSLFAALRMNKQLTQSSDRPFSFRLDSPCHAHFSPLVFHLGNMHNHPCLSYAPKLRHQTSTVAFVTSWKTRPQEYHSSNSARRRIEVVGAGSGSRRAQKSC